MIFKKGRYSGYIRPLAIIIDLVIIHILAKSFFVDDIQFLNYILFISISWIFISIKSNFYEVYRFTQLIKIFSLIGKQAVLFGLIVFAFFGFSAKSGCIRSFISASKTAPIALFVRFESRRRSLA